MQDDPYPYDYWITSESDPNFSITGDRSTNTVEADGWLVIPASTLTDTNIEATFDITINNDVTYEFDEKIITYEKILKIITPIIPHFTNECLDELKIKEKNKWPTVDK